MRAWWAMWVFGVVLLVFNWFWRSRPGLQAMADGVLLSAFTAMIAAATALLALLVLRRLEGRTLKGTKEAVTRWVIATDPPSESELPAKNSGTPDQEALAS